MKDLQERVLYIGQSRNLKQRLGSYRYVSSETHSRRIVRLVHAVEQITWEVTETEDCAIEKESLLLREVRPKFNRAGTYVRPEWYLHLEHDSCGLFLKRTEDWDAAHIGPFKANLQYSYTCILRLLWLLSDNNDPNALPRRLLMQNPPAKWSVQMSRAKIIEAFLRGESDELLVQFAALRTPSPFYTKFIEANLEQAMLFYDHIAAQ